MSCQGSSQYASLSPGGMQNCTMGPYASRSDSKHHDHKHGHSHDFAASSRTRLAIALTITATVLLAQIAGAVATGSLALLVDSAHMAVDSIGLIMALCASVLSARPRSARRSWGWLRAEIIAAGLQAAVLMGVGIYTVIEGARRLLSPIPAEDFNAVLLGIVGLVGFIANLASLTVLASARGHSLNMRAAFLEVLYDALGSVAVMLAAVVITLTQWTGADAMAGIVIALLVIPRAGRILRESGSVLMESAPRGLNLDDVAAHLETVEHVVTVHDLHASVVATGVPVLTAHVVVEDRAFHDGKAPLILDALQSCASEHFPVPVEHTTFQLEPLSHVSHEVLDHGPLAKNSWNAPQSADAR